MTDAAHLPNSRIAETSRRGGGLGRRIVGYMILTSAVLSIGATTIQLYLSYKRDLDAVQNEFRTVEESILPSLEKALWEFNFPLVEALLDGVVAQPDVIHAELVSATGQSWRKGAGEGRSNVIVRRFDLVHEVNALEEPVGSASVTISLENIRARLWNQFLTVLGSNFAKTLLAATVMLIIFDRMVSRHLRSIAKMTRDHSWGSDNADFDLQREGTQNDELTEITRSLTTANAQARAAQAKLLSKTDELEMTNTRLLQANKEQSEFTYAVSHDLKSPANTVSMLIDTLRQEENLSEDGLDLLADMETVNTRMRRMVDDVLDYSTVVGGPNTFEALDLNQILADIQSDLSAEIMQAEAQVNVDKLPTIRGAETQVRLLFQNLISNAVKFRDADRTPVVDVRSIVSDTGALIQVADNGIGVPPERRVEIFGLFNRLHARSEYEGTGLGLAICSRIMAHHGGSISAKAGDPYGTVFEVFFPFQPAQSPDHA